MTQTTELQAGPEMDAEIARRVFGCEPVRNSIDDRVTYYSCGCDQLQHGMYFHGMQCGELERYSESIAAAWLVVEKMHTNGWWVKVSAQWPLSTKKRHGADSSWQCRYDYAFDDRSSRPTSAVIVAESAPLAICRAALAALEAG